MFDRAGNFNAGGNFNSPVDDHHSDMGGLNQRHDETAGQNSKIKFREFFIF